MITRFHSIDNLPSRGTRWPCTTTTATTTITTTLLLLPSHADAATADCQRSCSTYRYVYIYRLLSRYNSHEGAAGTSFDNFYSFNNNI